MKTRVRRALLGAGAAVSLTALGAVGFVWHALRAPVPKLDGQAVVRELTRTVTVDSDRFGIPRIDAASREDAFRALGYLSARDRLFQMDLLRRLPQGRLAEIFGREAVEVDTRKRLFGFARVARAVVQRLPGPQRAVLEAYADGVNGFLARSETLPFEFRLLGYEPARWSAEDSILVALNMFEDLSDREEEERTRSVLARCVSPESIAFFSTPSDRYTKSLLGARSEPAPAIPAAELRILLAARATVDEAQPLLAQSTGTAPKGSNGWAVAGTRTADGRALLANDMHLDLALPNVWYRATLRYAGREISGVLLPGVPAIIAGSNGHVAWGITSLEGDVFDLIPVKLVQDRPDEYETPGGRARLEITSERLKVKGEADEVLRFRRTIWGPVAERPLLGQPVAIRWTALDPQAIDVGLVDLDGAQTIDEAIDIAKRAGIPPTNVLLADRHGRVGWTIGGRIPQRRGFDGSVAVPWSDGNGWDGYLAASAVPQLTDPSEGFVVNANQRMLAAADAPVLGHDFGNGYRAFRITERLRATPKVSEADMLALQLDTRSEFYEFYRDQALRALGIPAAGEAPLLAEARAALQAWNGKADPESFGLALLVRFRRLLSEQIFGAFLSSCRSLEPGFEITLGDVDAPVQGLLEERPAALVPPPASSWDEFVQGALQQAARQVADAHGEDLRGLKWGEVNRVRISHPLSEALPWVGRFLDMPREPLPGCGFCVRVSAGALGATERLVVAPGHESDGLLHMPGGQSGHPLSPHYDDQQAAWLSGRTLPLLPGPTVATLTLLRGEPASR
jgi:penicillin G amidase